MADPRSPLLADDTALERAATGAAWARGPCMAPARRAVRLSDIHNDRILEYSEEAGELMVFSAAIEYKCGRTLTDILPRLPDRFRVDVEGRIWSTSLYRIRIPTRDASATAPATT